MDDCGIYYDARRPSRLEHLLQHEPFDTALLLRARALIARIRLSRVTKYNVTGKMWRVPHEAQSKPTLLVIGQVEGDQSWLRGQSRYTSNEAFLRAVRVAYPNHYILFKPHPDVAAALRPGAVPDSVAARYCHATVATYDLDTLLQHVDEVHVMTSLTGFEALLRGKRVITHGAPFYAGWGLTVDLALPAAVAARRQRQLTVDALAAATLILYPWYVSAVTSRFTTPERLLDEITLMREGRLCITRETRYFAVALQLRQRCLAAWKRLRAWP
jgi:capsular polysaccharide export protein